MYEVRFSPAANRDISRALAYYQSQGEGLAERLFRALEVAELDLREAPARWAVWRAPALRRYLLKQFPYSLIYRIADPGPVDSHVAVLALFHHRRDPERRFLP